MHELTKFAIEHNPCYIRIYLASVSLCVAQYAATRFSS